MASWKEIKTIKDIIDNYSNMEKSIVQQLNLNVEHGPSIGGFREEIWKSLFEKIVPKKFSIERSVFIIDSKGHVSNEVDLAIFDEQYTPYIFRYGTLKFIPIEAVAVVIECKSSHIDEKQLINWAESISKLRTSFNSVTRMAYKIMWNKPEQLKEKVTNTQTSTRPLRILCYVRDSKITKDILKEKFDFIIKADSNSNKLIISCKKNDKNLIEWNRELNHYDNEVMKNYNGFDDKTEAEKLKLSKYTVENQSILTLIFQLNQLLMLINNPMLFPHMSYVNLFNNPETEIFESPYSLIDRLLRETLNGLDISIYETNSAKQEEKKEINKKEAIEKLLKELDIVNLQQLKESIKSNNFYETIKKQGKEKLIVIAKDPIDSEKAKIIYNNFKNELESYLDRVFKDDVIEEKEAEISTSDTIN